MENSTHQVRQELISEAVNRVRAIEQAQGVNPAALQNIESVLTGLTRHSNLFTEAEFPNPEPGQPARLYPLSEDADNRFALYLVCALPGGSVRPHNHSTWAVVAGLSGCEENRFFRRESGGYQPGAATIVLDRTVQVKPGQSVAMMPDDIHSVATPGDVPRRHLHMYGLSLEKLPERLAFDLAANTCETMEINPKIVRTAL
jgi:predicted metal-dependent enzyme (double-stranded beta helix superfamily)